MRAAPAPAVVEVDPPLASAEPDQEVQDLLRASPGANLGIDFLPGAPTVRRRVPRPVGFTGARGCGHLCCRLRQWPAGEEQPGIDRLLRLLVLPLPPGAPPG